MTALRLFRVFFFFGAMCSAAIFPAAIFPAYAQLLPSESRDRSRIEDVLASGPVVRQKQLSADVGINRPYKLTLENEGEHLACLWKNPSRKVDGQLDHWRYEIAAYRLDRLLGMSMVPPTVQRRFEGAEGSCQYWVDRARTVWVVSQEEDAVIPGEKALNWQRKLWLREAFDNLIANHDRNQGNVLVTDDWRLVLTDHSRAFCCHRNYTVKLLHEGPEVHKCLPREFVERLRALSFKSMSEAVGDSLTNAEIKGVLKRNKLLLKVIDQRIAELGEAEVLYDT